MSFFSNVYLSDLKLNLHRAFSYLHPSLLCLSTKRVFTSFLPSIFIRVVLTVSLLPYLLTILTTNSVTAGPFIWLAYLDITLPDSIYCGEIISPAILLTSGFFLEVSQAITTRDITKSLLWLFEFLYLDSLSETRLDQLFMLTLQYPQNNSSLYWFVDILTSANYSVPTSKSAVISFGIKFILLILLLIFVRGGIPRYRYDFLTKMGWFKYFSWVLLFFILSFFLYILFS